MSTKTFQILNSKSPQISGIKNQHNCASSWLHLEDKIYCNKITVEIIALAPQRKGLKLLTSRYSLKFLSASLILEAVKAEEGKNICIK